MIVIVDAGIGNLRSVQKAGELCGWRVRISDTPAVIQRAKKIIFPGVAHFGKAVRELKKRKLYRLLQERIQKGVPFLGICLGMQLLLEESEEAPGVSGLAVVKGKVKRFKKQGLIVPQMGWNAIRYQGIDLRCEGKTIFRGVPEGSFFYFAHSYYCAPQEKSVVYTATAYGGDYASSLHKDNVWAVQFHPEKSQQLGLKVLHNFLNL